MLTMHGELKSDLWRFEDGPQFCMHWSLVLVSPDARSPPLQEAVE